jgi:acetyltransferase-like isoleucine patch superfamily enzyme
MLNKIKKVPLYLKARIHYYFQWKVMKIQKNWVLNPLSYNLRPWLWKMAGVNATGKFHVGYDVYFDAGGANFITIDDGVWIASRSLILCHKRVLSDYKFGDDYNQMPQRPRPVHLKKGCVIGMGAIIMPGITIGEGAIVGAGAVVTRDVPPYTVVTGNPAVVVKEFPKQ